MTKNPPPEDREARDYFENMEVLRVPVSNIKTPLFLPSFAAKLTEILMSHRIVVKIETGYCLIVFPEGTYKTEMLPRTHDEKYNLVLPDAFELLEVKRRNEEFSYLQIEKTQLSPTEQQALKPEKIQEKRE